MDFEKLKISRLNTALQGLNHHRFLNDGQIKLRTFFTEYGEKKIAEKIQICLNHNFENNKTLFYGNYETVIHALSNLRITPLKFFRDQIQFLLENEYQNFNPKHVPYLYMSFLKINLESKEMIDYFEGI